MKLLAGYWKILLGEPSVEEMVDSPSWSSRRYGRYLVLTFPFVQPSPGSPAYTLQVPVPDWLWLLYALVKAKGVLLPGRDNLSNAHNNVNLSRPMYRVIGRIPKNHSSILDPPQWATVVKAAPPGLSVPLDSPLILSCVDPIYSCKISSPYIHLAISPTRSRESLVWALPIGVIVKVKSLSPPLWLGQSKR